MVIIAVSANVFAETRQRALAIGFNDFLIKPIQLGHLLDLLHTHLQLEWIYAQEPEATLEVESPTMSDLQAIAAFPPKEADDLFLFASQGYVRGVLSVLSEIERHDPKYLAAVKKLRALAQKYQFDQIIELLETSKKP
jgi:CheY-like chemotaxis protein